MLTDWDIEVDVLVIGGGGAGLRAAIEAAERGLQVMVLNRGPVGKSGLTVMGGGGIAAVMGYEAKDSPEQHFEDTVIKGYYLADQNLVEVLTTEAANRVRELEKFGGKGVKNPYLHTTGHRHPRGVFLKGFKLMQALKKWAAQQDRCFMMEDCLAFSLFVEDSRVVGVFVLDIRSGNLKLIGAKATVLATGGAGEVFGISSNAPHDMAGHAAGTGLALALRAGAKLVDLEMVQFHPSICSFPYVIKGVVFPFEVIVGRFGGHILNAAGEDFLDLFFKHNPFVRDMTAKLEYDEIRNGRGSEHGGIYLNMSNTTLPHNEIERICLKEYGSGLIWTYNHLKKLGYSLDKIIEFRPAEHHMCGGVRIDENGQTSLSGLFAAGEVAGNCHGANRLAGNAMSELLVFGKRAGASAAKFALKNRLCTPPNKQVTKAQKIVSNAFETKENGVEIGEVRKSLHQQMDDRVGPARHASGLKNALKVIKHLKEDQARRINVPQVKKFNLMLVKAIEINLILDVAEAIAASALFRQESRGNHQRDDFPICRNDTWLKHTILRIQDGELNIQAEPVILRKLFPEG